MFKESDIKTGKQLTDEGFYWVADRTADDAEWVPRSVIKDPDAQDGWMFSDDSFEPWEDIEEYHVFLGPFQAPTVPIPFERMNVVDFAPVAVKAPARIIQLGVPKLVQIVKPTR